MITLTLTKIITITILIIIKIIQLTIYTVNNNINIYLYPCFCVAVKVSRVLSEMLHGIHHFHIDHNAPCLPPKISLSYISLGTTVTPRRNWKQWLCKILRGKQGAL